MREPSASIVRKVQSGFSMFHLSGAKIRKIRSSPFHKADKFGNHVGKEETYEDSQGYRRKKIEKFHDVLDNDIDTGGNNVNGEKRRRVKEAYTACVGNEVHGYLSFIFCFHRKISPSEISLFHFSPSLGQQEMYGADFFTNLSRSPVE